MSRSHSLADFVTDRFGPELWPGTEENPTRQLARFAANVVGVRAAWAELRDPVPMVQLALMLGVERVRVLVAVTKIFVAAVHFLARARGAREASLRLEPGDDVTPQHHRLSVLKTLAGVGDYLSLGGFGAAYTPRERLAMMARVRACDGTEDDAVIGDLALAGAQAAMEECVVAWISDHRSVTAELLMRGLDTMGVGIAQELGVWVETIDIDFARKLRELLDVGELERAAIAAGLEEGDTAVYHRPGARARGARAWVVPTFAEVSP